MNGFTCSRLRDSVGYEAKQAINGERVPSDFGSTYIVLLLEHSKFISDHLKEQESKNSLLS